MPKRASSTFESQCVFLTNAEEKELLATYRRGQLAETRVKEGRELTNDLDLIDEGREAEERILVSHFPLVRSIAIDLYLKNKKCWDLEDLIGSGNEGLVIALRKFNPSAQNRFSTYATWWIRNRISTALRSGKWIIKIPDRVYKRLMKVMKFLGKFVQTNNDIPSIVQIAENLRLSVRAVRRCLPWLDHLELSLETPISDDGKLTLADLIENSSGISYKAIVATELKDKVRQALRTLTPREESVLKLRFGFDIDDAKSLNEIGDSYALTAERIRQIEVDALRKLRHPSRQRALRPFLRHISEQ